MIKYATLAFVLLAAILQPCRAQTRPTGGDAYPLVVKLTDSARNASIPEANINIAAGAVYALLDDASLKSDEVRIQGVMEVIDTLVSENKHALSKDPESAKRRSYWIAFLIAECLRQEVPEARLREEINSGIELFATKLTRKYESKIRLKVTKENYQIIEADVAVRLQRFRDELISDLQMLSADVCFPGLKEPLSDKVYSHLVSKLSGQERKVPGFSQPDQLMVTPQEAYLESLDSVLTTLKGDAVYLVMEEVLYRKMQKGRYWGDMNVSMQAAPPKSRWPVIVDMEPLNSGAAERGWSR